MWICIGFVLLFAAGAFLFWLLDPDLRRRRAYEDELAARVPLSDREWASRYFPDAELADTSFRVRRLFAEQMDYPADRLLPDDDFWFFWAELDAAPLLEALEHEFGVIISPEDAEATPPTIRRVSELMQRLHAERVAAADRPRE